MIKYTKLMALLVSGSLLAGCHTLKTAKVTTPNFQPGFQYKRLVINNTQEAWVLSGLTEDWPVPANSVWFSSDKGVLRFAQGRFVGYATVQPRRQWQESVNTPINWVTILSGKPQQITRCITDFPKHTQDNCQQHHIQLSTQQPKKHAYVGNASDLRWVVETPKHSTNKKQRIWYAFSKHTKEPVYGQLCIDHTNCMSWQNWQVS